MAYSKTVDLGSIMTPLACVHHQSCCEVAVQPKVEDNERLVDLGLAPFPLCHAHPYAAERAPELMALLASIGQDFLKNVNIISASLI
jgi:hypothetical protein